MTEKFNLENYLMKKDEIKGRVFSINDLQLYEGNSSTSSTKSIMFGNRSKQDEVPKNHSEVVNDIQLNTVYALDETNDETELDTPGVISESFAKKLPLPMKTNKLSNRNHR